MPLPLDTLLFWIGLVITFVGLYVFITGRSSSDKEKKGSNRFEAFGIKIDVSNPSLLLVILGVVMMMAPKFIPQTPDLKDSDAIAVVADIMQKTEDGQPQPMEKKESASPAPAPEDNSPPPRPDVAPTENVPVEKKTPPEEPEHTQVITGKSQEQMRRKVKTVQPESVASLSRPPAPRPRPSPSEQKPPEPAAKPLLLVFARAETSQKAGMRSDTIKSYTKKLGNELARQAAMVFAGDLEVRYEIVKGIDSALRRGGGQVYVSLCREHDADLLFLGNLTIPFSMSDIESTYWPDLEMHLVNCSSQVSRKRTVNHLNPKNGDAFIFQQSISRAGENFLLNSRGILR